MPIDSRAWPLLTTFALALALSGCALKPSQAAITFDAFGARGLYVIDSPTYVSDAGKQDALIALLHTRSIGHVALYHLDTFLAGAPADSLAAFMNRLRTAAHIKTIGSPVSAASRLDALNTFMAAHPNARFDTVITEYEYWTACQDGPLVSPNTPRADCFPKLIDLLDRMNAFADAQRVQGHEMQVAAYLGYPNLAEVEQISQRVSYVLLNYPVSTATAAWGFKRSDTGPFADRFKAFASHNTPIWPIFYVEGEVPMNAWLQAHGLHAAEEAFISDLEADMGKDARSHLGGFQFFGEAPLFP